MKCILKPHILVLADVPLVGNPIVYDISPAIGGRPTGTFTADQLEARLKELYKKSLAGKAHALQMLEQLEKGHTGTMPTVDCDREVTYLFPGTRVLDGDGAERMYSLHWVIGRGHDRTGDNGWVVDTIYFPHDQTYPVDKYRIVVIGE